MHLNFYVYYGPDRVRDPALLSKQDIVLTTYNILTHDYGVSMLILRDFQKLNLSNCFRFLKCSKNQASYSSLNI